jgi:hypothetical protein
VTLPTLQRFASGRALVLSLVAIAAFSTLVRVLLGTAAHAPTVFMDEMGYTKLAQSIGLDGRMALFNEEGFSYSPLYPALLAPIYALGASGATAYTLIKVVNAFLISLSVFPLYRIARFVLPPNRSLLVAAVSVFAPLMSYPSFTMSENLAYPIALVAIWAMLAAVRTPGVRADALLLAAIAVATAARIQLIVLLPAALTAVLLSAVTGREPGLGRRILRSVQAHSLLFGVTGAGFLVAGVRALAGGDVLAVFGRYAGVGRVGLPSPWRVLELAVHHLAGLDLAVGVIPFLAALVAAVVFVRSGFPAHFLPFAVVAVSLTGWLLLQIAVDAALYDVPGGDEPRIHERFMIYAVPFFLIALLKVVHIAETRASERVHLAAAALAAALPAVLPFDTYVNRTNGFENFALVPFGETNRAGELVAAPWARAFAILVAATLALSYVRMLRGRLRRTLVYVAAVFAVVSAFVWSRIDSASEFGRSTLPAHVDWVDRANPSGRVVLVAGENEVAALETAFYNLTIARVYTLCEVTFSSEFGERRVALNRAGAVRAGSEQVRADYAVVPAKLGIEGEVVARNRQGGQVLIAPVAGRLTATPGVRAKGCE